MSHISFFQNGIKQKKPTIDTSIDKVLHAFKHGTYKDLINKIRATDDKSTLKILKSDLPYVTFSGTFITREVDRLLAHSGFICLDFDDLEPYDVAVKKLNQDQFCADFEELSTLENAIKKVNADQYTYSSFISPSGKGLKVLVKIDPAKHLESFLFLEDYFYHNHRLTVDKSGKDVSRACFVSYDENLYLNPDSVSVIIKEEAEPSKEATPPTPPLKAASKQTVSMVDEETGEVIEVDGTAGWDYKKRKYYERAIQVVDRIMEAKKDVTSAYDNWLQIGFAFSVFGELGRPLFHKVSSFHPDYNEKTVDDKFTNAIKTSKFTTPDIFFKIVKDYGIDNRFIRTLQPGVAEGAEGKGYEDWSYILPFDDWKVTPEMKKEVNQYGFIERDNQYYYAKYEFKSKTISINNISNFVIKPLFLIQSNSDPKRLFEIRNKYNLSKIIDVPAKALVSITEFNSFVEGKGNFLMNANKIEFHRIKEKLYDLTKDAEEIKTLGWHKDGFYAFANGIYNARFTGVDDFGIIAHKIETEEGEEDRHYFIPAMSSIYRNEEESYEMEKKFVYVPRPDVKFREWADLFCKVHKENGQIGLCYYIASIFRDIIYHRFKFFPHLFLFGPPGTGKSNMGWSISYMFGLERKPFNLNAGTAVGFHRTFAQFRNACVWFDEYSNSIELKRIQDLKGAYDGAGHVKGEFSATGGSSNKTTSTPVNSACMISGQELPVADNALFKRVILCQYYKTQFTDEEADLNDQLRIMQSKGLSHITGSLTRFRKKVQEEYHQVFNEVISEFKEEMAKDGNIEERIMMNAAIPVAMFKLLDNDEGGLHFPFTYKQIKETFFANIRSQNGLISSAKETNTFWDQVDFLVSRGEIKDGEDFKVKRIQSLKVMKGRGESETKDFALPKDVLFLCMTKVHPLYLESLRKQGQNKGMDKNSLTHYLSHSREFIGLVNKTTFKIGDKTTSTSAYAFDYEYMEKLGYNFRRFVDDGTEGDEDEKPVTPF